MKTFKINDISNWNREPCKYSEIKELKKRHGNNPINIKELFAIETITPFDLYYVEENVKGFIPFTIEDYIQIGAVLCKRYSTILPHPLIDQTIENCKRGIFDLKVQRGLLVLEELFKKTQPTVAKFAYLSAMLCEEGIALAAVREFLRFGIEVKGEEENKIHRNIFWKFLENK